MRTVLLSRKHAGEMCMGKVPVLVLVLVPLGRSAGESRSATG